MWNRIRDRGRHPMVVAATAATLAVGLHGVAFHGLVGTGVAGSVFAAALFVHAYLVLALVDDVQTVPSTVAGLAVAGAIGSVALPFVTPGPLATFAVTATMAYLAGTSLVVALAMRSEVAATGGVTAGRSRLIGVGGGAFAVAFGASAIQAVWPSVGWAATPLFQLTALTGALGYFLGFSPPAWLSDAWRLSEIGDFLSTVSRIRPEERPTDLFAELRSAARQGVDGRAAYVAVPDRDAATLRLQDAGARPATFTDRHGAVGRAWFRQDATLTRDPERMEDAERRLLADLHADALITVPISSEDQRRGVLLVALDRIPLFPEEDLDLLEKMARQTARALDNIAYSRDQARMVEKLRETNEELKASRATLQETKERFRAVAETAHDGIITFDDRGEITYVNPAIETIFDVSADRLEGRPVTELIADPDHHRMDGILDAFGTSGGTPRLSRTVELTGVRRGGETLPIEVSLAGWRTVDGRFVTGIVRDLTERKRVEQELRDHRERLQDLVEARTRELEEANARLKREVQERIDVESELRKHRERLEERVEERTAELEEANARLQEEIEERERFEAELEKRNRELEDFAYVVSHDLKAPLRGIHNLATWIEEDLDGALPDATQENLHLLRTRVDRMGRMIDSILEYSRVGRVAEEPEKVDVDELLDHVVGLIDPPDGFEIVVDGDMPTLVADRIRLQRVFQNLIANAIDHHDRAEGRVRVASRMEHGRIRFAVEDDGPGIPTERQEEIFRIFETLEPKDDHETTGVGLTLVKKIVETHGGDVRVASGSGRGTRIEFTWPTVPETEVGAA